MHMTYKTFYGLGKNPPANITEDNARDLFVHVFAFSWTNDAFDELDMHAFLAEMEAMYLMDWSVTDKWYGYVLVCLRHVADTYHDHFLRYTIDMLLRERPADLIATANFLNELASMQHNHYLTMRASYFDQTTNEVHREFEEMNIAFLLDKKAAILNKFKKEVKLSDMELDLDDGYIRAEHFHSKFSKKWDDVYDHFVMHFFIFVDQSNIFNQAIETKEDAEVLALFVTDFLESFFTLRTEDEAVLARAVDGLGESIMKVFTKDYAKTDEDVYTRVAQIMNAPAV